MSEDIKSLLDKAFGPEPPLTLDREAIVRSGRRRVRNRRLAASVSVAAAVVAVVLGAAALSNIPSDGKEIAAGQSAGGTPIEPATTTSSDIAPQGPQLPLTTTEAPAVRRAADLTQVLAEARLIPSGLEVRGGQADGGQPLRFVYFKDSYSAGADLRDANGSGRLIIQVGRADEKGAPVACDAAVKPPDTCSVVIEYGLRMSLATQNFDAGVLNYLVHTRRSDGTDIVAIASNSVNTSGAVMKATRAKPPVDFEVLKRIAALPRLTIG